MLYKVIDSSLFINGKVVHEGETVDLPETFAESIIRFLKPINKNEQQSSDLTVNESKTINKSKRVKNKSSHV